MTSKHAGLLILAIAFTGTFANDGILFPGSADLGTKSSTSSSTTTGSSSSPPSPSPTTSTSTTSASTELTCATKSGVTCIFPFIFGNETFTSCIRKSDPDRIPWCSTKVDPVSRVHVSGGGHWGHCNSACPVVADEQQGGVGAEIERFQEDGSNQNEVFQECTTDQGEKGACKPGSLCVGLSVADEEANICSESGFICCKEFLKNQEGIVDKLAASSGTKIAFEKPDGVSVADVDETLTNLRFGQTQAVEAEQEEEVFVGGQGQGTVQNSNKNDNSAVNFHLRFNAPRTDEVLAVDAVANNLQSATTSLSEQTSNTIGLRFFDSSTSSRINDECPWTPEPTCTDSIAESKFRTMDGTCNNLAKPNYGRAGTPFQRILDSDYSDGNLALPRKSKEGFELPSARSLSANAAKSNVRNEVTDDIQTVLVMQMGQFIDHDITHTPQHSIKDCCNDDGSFPSSFDSNKCYPIDVPRNDEFWGPKGVRCMNFPRSLSSPTLKCSLEARQQMNQITHWLDASNIYGSSDNEMQKLRQFAGGQLKVTRQSGSTRGILPSCAAQVAKSAISTCKACDKCFFAGDVRANEQLNLIVMHTVWLREHNRIARFLQKLNPHWNDERLFQEAKRIATAEYQHIVYKEWLPLILGKELMDSFALWPLSKGYSDDYLNTFDSRVTNEFATAAFRFGHSLIPSNFARVVQQPRSRNSRNSNLVSQSLSMRDIFFRPEVFKNRPGIMDEMVRGLTSQHGDKWDKVFSEDVTNHLFEVRRGTGGLDLVALNIQRGRDHGIRGYNEYRNICGVGKARNFDDLTDYLTTEDVAKLKNLYRDVDDIDLYVGGFLERPHRDSILGPTFKCLISDTFARLKLGDRFFYDLGLDPNVRFDPIQLQEIRKTSMARVLCDNTDRVREMQPSAFRMPGSASNKKTSCDNIAAIPVVQLSVFQDRGRDFKR